MSVAHSPLPWRVDPSANRGGSGTHCGITCEDGEGVFVADIYADCEQLPDAVAEANAEFIVRACNSHHDLIAALKSLRFGNCWCVQDPELVGQHSELCKRVDAALAKAEEGR